jgi:hypothetical protein
MHGHVLAGNQAVSRPSEWTRVPAHARADVPVLYPRCLAGQRAVAPDRLCSPTRRAMHRARCPRLPFSSGSSSLALRTCSSSTRAPHAIDPVPPSRTNAGAKLGGGTPGLAQ